MNRKKLGNQSCRYRCTCASGAPMAPCHAKHLSEPKCQPQEHPLGCAHGTACCQAPFCSPPWQRKRWSPLVWENAAWKEARQAAQAKGRAPRAATSVKSSRYKVSSM